MTLLTTDKLTKKFGGVTALDRIGLSIGKGEILGMIGPNGSGKTTFINVLTGIYTPEDGNVSFGQEDITGLPVHRITQKGIARTFQNLRVFQNVSVLYNVLIGRHCRIANSLTDIFLRPRTAFRREKEARDRAVDVLELARLAGHKDEMAKNLSYGDQRLLEICRALASEPRLLLLDEPCAGMNPVEMDTLAQFVLALKAKGLTIFIIEHNMRFIMSIAERIVVLEAGRQFREGLPADIQKDPEVQRIYLGEEAQEDASAC
jgi:branched-chain amino acid transport system ATP-binding protein